MNITATMLSKGVANDCKDEVTPVSTAYASAMNKGATLSKTHDLNGLPVGKVHNAAMGAVGLTADGKKKAPPTPSKFDASKSAKTFAKTHTKGEVEAYITALKAEKGIK